MERSLPFPAGLEYFAGVSNAFMQVESHVDLDLDLRQPNRWVWKIVSCFLSSINP
jgi:hypothetical protein